MPRSGISLIDLPDKYQKQAAAQLAPRSDLRARGVALLEPAKRLRQSAAKLNKTESAFGEWLLASAPTDALIHSQSITLKLANGCRYTPDFVVMAGRPVAYEVKGFMREDAAVKIKVAAAAYPWIQFFLVWRKGRASAWQFQEILS